MSSYSHIIFFYPERVDILSPDFYICFVLLRTGSAYLFFAELLYSIVYSARWVYMGLNKWFKLTMSGSSKDHGLFVGYSFCFVSWVSSSEGKKYKYFMVPNSTFSMKYFLENSVSFILEIRFPFINIGYRLSNPFLCSWVV